MGLDTVDLIVRIETYLSISIPDRQAEKIVTVQDICAIVFKLLPTSDIDRVEIENAVKTIISDHTGLKISEMDLHKSITSDLGLD
jgi:acyl carrier protein